MLNAYIYNGIRTPFGRNAGALAKVRPDNMMGAVIKEVVENSPFEAADIDDVNIGCGNQAGEDSRCVARHAVLLAGLPIEIPGSVVQRNCGSGMNAIISAAHAITCGEGDLIVAGGVESMTRAPFVVGKAETAFAKSFPSFESSLGARFPNPKIESEFGADTMPETADNLAREFQLSREEVDNFAAESQSKYAAAKADGFFDEELMAIMVPGERKKPDVSVGEDEHPRPGTNLETLGGMRPLFSGGVTTAGNASGINDGASALVLANEKQAKKGKPMAKIISYGFGGVEPDEMGLGPIPASKMALKKVGLTIDDLDLVESNEAFAAQACAVNKELGLDEAKVNVNGGAIALGHPVGATGSIIMTKLVHELKRRNGKYGLATMCIGGGQGIAVIVENC